MAVRRTESKHFCHMKGARAAFRNSHVPPHFKVIFLRDFRGIAACSLDYPKWMNTRSRKRLILSTAGPVKRISVISPFGRF